MVTMVLLNEAWMCAMPWETCLRSFFLNVFFLPFFSGAAGPPAAAGFAIGFQSLLVGLWSLVARLVANDQRLMTNDCFMSSSLSSSSRLPFLCADLCEYGHWYGYVVRGLADSDDGDS